MPQDRRPDRETHREVLSFVRRSTRMNDSQARAWREAGPRYVVPVARDETSYSIAEQQVDWPATFGREAPLAVEIGSGAGDSLVAMARDRPDLDVVAFEVFPPGMASTVVKLRDADVDNVRLVDGNGVQGLERLFAAGSLAQVWVFFPDPWPKSRHRKRRLVQPEFADLVASRLQPGGSLRLATDWAPYAEEMRRVLDPHPDLVNVHGDGDGWAPSPGRPVTRFEGRGRDAGHTIRDLHYRRR